MTNKEKQDILVAAIDRAYTVISETAGKEMQDQTFGDLLFHIERMGALAAELNSAEPEAHASAPVSEPSEETEPEQAQTPKEATPSESEKEGAPTYTREEVKRALARARVKGVNAMAVLRQVGADSFMTLTENKFAEVMQIIEQELANAS